MGGRGRRAVLHGLDKQPERHEIDHRYQLEEPVQAASAARAGEFETEQHVHRDVHDRDEREYGRNRGSTRYLSGGVDVEDRHDIMKGNLLPAAPRVSSSDSVDQATASICSLSVLYRYSQDAVVSPAAVRIPAAPDCRDQFIIVRHGSQAASLKSVVLDIIMSRIPDPPASLALRARVTGRRACYLRPAVYHDRP